MTHGELQWDGTKLPAEWVAQARSDASKELVAGLELQMWVGLQVIAKQIVANNAEL